MRHEIKRNDTLKSLNENTVRYVEFNKDKNEDVRIEKLISKFNKLVKELNPLYFRSISLDIEDKLLITIYVNAERMVESLKDDVITLVTALGLKYQTNIYLIHDNKGNYKEDCIELNTNSLKVVSSKLVRVYKGISFYGKRLNQDSYIELINQRWGTTESGEDILNSQDTLEDELLGYARDVLGRV